MIKSTKKFALNSKFLKFFLIPAILFSTPLFCINQYTKAGLEFQWDQNSGYRRIKWLQKDNKKRFKNKIYFFLRPIDRNAELLKITLAIPKPFKSTLKKEKISFCKVRIGGFEERTKCLEDIPADIEINTDESTSLRSINIYPYKPIPNNKDSYSIVLKANNPNKSGLFQFHIYGQLKGNTVSSYLGSSTIVIN